MPGVRSTTITPTWAQLVALEPRLQALLDEAKSVDGSDEHFCANRVWYGNARNRNGIKERLCRLVGWDVRRHGGSALLSSEAAYDVAYETIYDALPGCRECGCF